MSDLGRILVLLGLAIIVVGLVFIGLTRLNFPLGRLPGDFAWRGRGWSIFFPLGTSILLSVILSLILWAISRFHR